MTVFKVAAGHCERLGGFRRMDLVEEAGLSGGGRLQVLRNYYSRLSGSLRCDALWVVFGCGALVVRLGH